MQKSGKWVSLCCTVDYKFVTEMDVVKFEFNVIIYYYCQRKTIPSWDGSSAKDILYYIIIINMVG